MHCTSPCFFIWGSGERRRTCDLQHGDGRFSYKAPEGGAVCRRGRGQGLQSVGRMWQDFERKD
ncbi:hypothetical protein D7X48_09745 [bacterium D16-50]|nr:hypothetical protein D7X48_09745 [bacterium D16-50]